MFRPAIAKAGSVQCTRASSLIRAISAWVVNCLPEMIARTKMDMNRSDVLAMARHAAVSPGRFGRSLTRHDLSLRYRASRRRRAAGDLQGIPGNSPCPAPTGSRRARNAVGALERAISARIAQGRPVPEPATEGQLERHADRALGHGGAEMHALLAMKQSGLDLERIPRTTEPKCTGYAQVRKIRN